MAKSVITRLVPPKLIKGSGIPVNGTSDSMAAMLMTDWHIIQRVIPAATRRENMSGAALAILKPRYATTPSRPITTIEPIRPNSSAITAKIESFEASGR